MAQLFVMDEGMEGKIFGAANGLESRNLITKEPMTRNMLW